MDKIVQGNLYTNTADLYDYDNRSIIKDDLDFYVEYANQTSGDILELASGTGRVSLYLAEKTKRNIKCIEYSQPMINKFKDKLNTVNKDCSEYIDIIHGDMSSFNLDKKFEYIIIPWRALQWLPTEKQAISCLNSVYQHLSPNGLFIFDVFEPGVYNDDWLGNETISYVRTLPDKTEITRSSVNINYNNDEGYIQYLNRISVKQNGTTSVHEDTLTIKYFRYDEITSLLKSQGFKIVEEFGYYDKCPIGKGSEMIFVCTK